MADTKACKDCGKQFAKSRNDSTVRCPSCRAGGGAKPAARPRSTGVYGSRSCATCDGIGLDPKALPVGGKYPTCPSCGGSGKQSSVVR